MMAAAMCEQAGGPPWIAVVVHDAPWDDIYREFKSE
jgi:hypothetical protein